jgi:hypothetical protein
MRKTPISTTINAPLHGDYFAKIEHNYANNLYAYHFTEFSI